MASKLLNTLNRLRRTLKKRKKDKNVNTKAKSVKAKSVKAKSVKANEKENQEFDYLNCSPISVNNKQANGGETRKLSHTCYNRDGLLKIRNKWNARHQDPSMKIETDKPELIWETMKQRLDYICDNELCWVRQNFIEHDNKDLIDNFSPKAPQSWKKNPSEWLSSTDIIKIMKQYEQAYPNYRFIGPSAIDFDTILDESDNKCVYDDLCKFNIQDFIKKNINKIGIVFNTDPHTKGGSHWIALFIDIKNGYIFYFDSNGSSMPKQVKTFIERIQGQIQDLTGQPLEEDNNVGFTHQRKDGQCGMYVLYFIVELLTEQTPPKSFKTERITDEHMRQYREILYN